uniref:Tail protein n=1 Tax=Siphoviridae sp. ctgBD49 TaxID=2826420 RepID=A0A8S5QP98_9CAUD|nr:MAG TPA: tail protein [Siphoviridae sp. ctgBD49]
MSDIYVFGPNDDTNDYSSFGLVGAILPTEATFTEAGNGDSSVSITCPLDEFGRYASLVKGNILLCPVPVRTTPEIQNGSCVTTVWTYKVKPLNQLTNKKQRTLYKKQKGSSRLKIMNAGDIVTVVLKPTSSTGSEARWKVKSKYGTGWIIPDGFELVTEKKIDNNANAIQEVQSPWTVQPQRFRIYEVEKTIDEVTVQARHISYDLLYNLTTYKSDESVKLQTALDGVLNNCVDGNHGFTAYTNVANEQAGLAYDGKNPIDAMLDPDEGLCAKYKVNLIRDNDELFFLNDPGMNRGVKIVYGKNMTGVTYTQSDDQVSTRIMPVGENKDGTPLYLSDNPSERFVDSTNINNYPIIHVYRLECDNCKVGQKDSNGSKVTVAVARARMRQQAEDLLKTGVDNPTIKMEVEFVNLGDTEEYDQFKNLENCFLYDYLIIQHGKQDINVTAQIQEIEWDILTDMMKSVTIGTVGETLANMGITTWQIPTGFSGSKIANGTLGGGALREDAIATRHLQADSVNASVIAAHSITADRLDTVTVNAMTIEAVQARIRELVAGQITTDQLYVDLAEIAKAQITTANIKEANIDWATITNLSTQIADIAKAEIQKADIKIAQIEGLEAEIAKITLAKISTAVINGAQIENASIGTAQIALGAITSALIEEGAVGELQIADASITDAKIVSLNADVISTGTLSVDRLLIKGPNGLFRAINATDEGLTVEELSKEQYQNGMSGTVIVARSITADKIKASSITANEILSNTITADKINIVNLFASEATIHQLDSYLLKTETIEALQGKLDIWANDKISLGVNNLRIGGTNLVLNTDTINGDKTVAFGAPATGSTTIYNTYDGAEYSAQHAVRADFTAGGAGSNVYWFPSYSPALINGRTYTWQIKAYISDKADGLDVDIGLEAGGLTTKHLTWGWQTYSHTFVYDSSNTYKAFHINGVFTAGDKLFIADFKIEEGDKATGWTRHPDEQNRVKIGSNILMDEDHTEISTPYLDIDVSGTEGDTHIDENGISTGTASFETLNCPKIVKRSIGRNVTITTPSGLQAEFDRINGGMLDGSETITLACDQYGDVILRGIYGNNTELEIVGGYSINGSVTIVDCHAQKINFDGVTINSTVKNAVAIYNSAWVRFGSCTLNTASAYDGVQIYGGSIAMVYNTGIYNAANALNIDWGGRLDFLDLKGTSTTYLWAKGCVVTGNGSRPSGNYVGQNVISNWSDMMTIAVNTGSGITPPAAVTTTSYTANVTGTYYPSGHWINDNTIRQGHEGTGSNGRKDYGCMWFDAGALAGKTIKSATLTIKRISGKGRSSSVTLKLWTTTLTGKSGKPTDSLVSLGEIGKIANGETATFDVPVSAIGVIATGGGLVLYTEETTNKTGKTYSENYAHFEGTDGAAPVLTVTYQ